MSSDWIRLDWRMHWGIQATNTMTMPPLPHCFPFSAAATTTTTTTPTSSLPSCFFNYLTSPQNFLSIPASPLSINLLCPDPPTPVSTPILLRVMTDPHAPLPQNSLAEPRDTPAADVQNQAPAGMSNIVRRWRREDLIKKGSLALRAFALLCSLLAFIIMASNKHGDGRNFDQYDPYKYVLATAILSTLYTGLQVARQLHELSKATQIFSRQTMAVLDFSGDQVVSYLLISAASSAVPLTNSLREGADNIFTDSSASAISMAFLAFFALAISAIISGYKLANQTYI